jgi:hypothetical protein
MIEAGAVLRPVLVVHVKMKFMLVIGYQGTDCVARDILLAFGARGEGYAVTVDLAVARL